jgi:predicted DNA-binding transcriptional regulator YafY
MDEINNSLKDNTGMIYNDGMKPRKTLPKTALPRIYFIDQEIASGRYPNAPSMAEKYETSVSSINRDIDFMRNSMGAPIEYDFYKKGFYYTEKNFRISAAYATTDDLLALGMAKSLMDLYRDTPIHDAALNLLESITVPLQEGSNTEWYKDRIIVPKAVTVPVEPKVWQCIISGLRENRVITFSYQDADVKDTVKYEGKKLPKLDIRRIHPYQLLFDRSAWYLSGYDEDRKDKRMFALSRISNIAPTNDKFTLKGGFDYRSAEGESYFGVFTGGKVYKFIVEINGDARWVKERIWAKDQKIQETKTGPRSAASSIKLSFTSNQFDKVMDWILSQGANARPLAPKPLVDRWKAVVKAMGKLAGK